jgi:quinol monooxygenase YgiN
MRIKSWWTKKKNNKKMKIIIIHSLKRRPLFLLVLFLVVLAMLSSSGFLSCCCRMMVTISGMKYNQIQFRAEFTIEEGKIEEYKKLVKKMSRVVEANEPDTINYQFCLNRDGTKCIVYETYSNSEAVFAHINGVASQTILPKIFNVSKISKFEVYGNPREELQKLLTIFSPHIYTQFTGFTR